MKDTLYRTIHYYTTTNSVEGVLPKIGKKKLLEKLAKHGVTEADVDKTLVKLEDGRVGYWVHLNIPRTALDIEELKGSK